MSGDALDFNNIGIRGVKFSFLQGKAPKEIRAILIETLGERAPSYATVKNWLAQCKRDFFICDAQPEIPKTVYAPEIIDQIQELLLEDCRIWAKSIAKQVGISRESVGSSIHEDLGMRKLSAKWVPKCLNADQKHHWCHSSDQIWKFFGSIQIISSHNW
jgi:histone-lysine N-methyltransferase SETMAR